MLLTSSQISMAISSSIVFVFTSLLFLSGYVLQQQTVRSLQAVIKPKPIAPPPPSPVLAKHFGTPPGHSFYDKYLASNRPKGGWVKVAYAQLVKEQLHVCNALMLFAVLEEQESMAQRIMMYPKEWDQQASEQKTLDPTVETSRRLLREAAKRYRVMLQPVEPMLKVGQGESVFPLAGLLSLLGYNRLVYLPPSGLVLDTSGLDHLFTLPMDSNMLGISAGSEGVATTPSVVLLSPSKEAYQTTLESLPSENYDEETFLSKLPLLADLPEDQIYIVAKTSSLRHEDDAFDAADFLDTTSYIHISDSDMLGPEYDSPREMVTSARPRQPQPRKAWQDVYEKYRQRRMDICGLDLEPAPKPARTVLDGEEPKV